MDINKQLVVGGQTNICTLITGFHTTFHVGNSLAEQWQREGTC